VLAILTALHAIPINVPLLIASDAESALQAIWKPVVANGKAFRTGARSLVSQARDLLALRHLAGTPTSWMHVESHTGKSDAISRGNAMADHRAGLAAGEPRPPALSHEHAFTFWRCCGSCDHDGFCPTPYHISGNLRASLKKGERSTLLESWRTKTTAQGDVARGSPGILRWLDHVRRTGDNVLFNFLIRAITKQLATADKLNPQERLAGIPLLCPICSTPENHLHPFLCHTMQNRGDRAASTTREQLRTLCVWVIDSGTASHSHCESLDRLWAESVLFDPRNHTTTTHDTFAGSLGVLPPNFASALTPNSELSGGEHRLKITRKGLPARITTFRLTVLRQTMHVYHAWVRLSDRTRNDGKNA
jgi:hypothetical protein